MKFTILDSGAENLGSKKKTLKKSRMNFRGSVFAGFPFLVFLASLLLTVAAKPVAAASSRNPYPPVNDNGTVGDAAGTDTAAYVNDKPDLTPSPQSGTSTPIPNPDVPGRTSTPPIGSDNTNNGTNANGANGSNSGSNNGSNNGGSSVGGSGGPGVGSGSSGSGSSGNGGSSGSGGSGAGSSGGSSGGSGGGSSGGSGGGGGGGG